MATSEEARLIQQRRDANRQAVITAACTATEGAGDEQGVRQAVSLALEAGMLFLADLWHREAAALETSTKHGSKTTRDRLRAAAQELAGFAAGLAAHGAIEAPAPQLPIEMPVPAPAVVTATAGAGTVTLDVPAEVATDAARHVAYIAGETDAMPPQLDPIPPGMPAAVIPVQRVAAEVIAPAPLPKRLTWEDTAGLFAAMSVPDHGSFSTISDLADCGVKYALTRISRDVPQRVTPEKPTWWNVAGTAFHSAVETIERTFMLTDSMPNFDPERAWAAHFQTAIAEAITESGVDQAYWAAADKGKENFDFWRVLGPDLLRKYMTYWGPKRAEGWQIFVMPDGRPALELALTLDVNGWPFECIIDQVWRRPDGNLQIDDLKSGGSKPASGFQLGGYAHALTAELHTAGVAVSAISGAYYIARAGSHDGEIEDLRAKHPWMELAMRAYAARTQMNMRAFLPRVSDWGGGCGSCAHNAICPARG